MNHSFMIKLKWYFIRFHYKIDLVLDGKLRRLLLLEIQSITPLEHGKWLCIRFSDGKELKIWNRSKYRGWMSQGKIISKSGSFLYAWQNARPSRRIMLWLIEKLQQFEE